MADLLVDIKTFLTGKLAPTVISISRDVVPKDGDPVIILQEYIGSPAVLGDTYAHRSVQILVRSTNATTAKGHAWSIYKWLQTANLRVDFTASRFGLVYLRQPPFKIKVDEAGRIFYGFNMGVTTAND